MTSIIPSEKYPSAEEIAVELKRRLFRAYQSPEEGENCILLISDETFRCIAQRQKVALSIYHAVYWAGLDIGIVVGFGNCGTFIATDNVPENKTEVRWSLSDE